MLGVGERGLPRAVPVADPRQAAAASGGPASTRGSAGAGPDARGDVASALASGGRRFWSRGAPACRRPMFGSASRAKRREPVAVGRGGGGVEGRRRKAQRERCHECREAVRVGVGLSYASLA